MSNEINNKNMEVSDQTEEKVETVEKVERVENSVDIIFILDESGSMQIMGSEPQEAVNSFIDEQKKVMDSSTSKFSLWTFNTSVTKVIDDEDLCNVSKFENFKPSSMTALYDAIGEAITTKKNKPNCEKVICVILTDGQENSSTKYDQLTINSMIHEMEVLHKWKFIFLGANQDVYSSGKGLGIARQNCAEFICSPGGLLNLTRQTSATIGNYRAASAQDPDVEFSLTADTQDITRTDSIPPPPSFPPPPLLQRTDTSSVGCGLRRS
jgi:hypothetical protein